MMTPNSNRLHIALFGRRNSGKSSLINALTGQDVALVSDTPGTTTDPVLKAMEIQGVGPCLFIDTPGYDDEGELGEMRMTRTLKAAEKTDIALLLCHPDMDKELQWIQRLKEKNIPVILLLNKADILEDAASIASAIKNKTGESPLIVSANTRKTFAGLSSGVYPKTSMHKASQESLFRQTTSFYLSCRRIYRHRKGGSFSHRHRPCGNCWIRNALP